MMGRFTEGLGIKFTGVYFAVSQGSPNLAPRAVLSAGPQAGIAPLTVRFDASESTDADGTILTYSWDFGDGTSSQEMVVNKTYGQPGNYRATLSVTDDMGAYSQASVNIAVGPFAPIAAFSINPAEGFAPLMVHTDGSASSDVDGTITGYDWDFGDGSTGTGVTSDHTYNESGNYQITLTVTDDGGSQSTATYIVNVLPVGSNLLTDGGFENGGQSWANIGSSGLKVVASTFHSGSKSVEIAAPTSGSKLTHQTVAVNSGQVYDISGFVKTEGITNVVQISVQWQTGSGSLISTSNIGSTMQGTVDWTLRSKRLTAPSTAGKVQIRLIVKNGSGKAWFDDLVVK
jgi:PKD repeat protein